MKCLNRLCLECIENGDVCLKCSDDSVIKNNNCYKMYKIILQV